MKKTLEQLLRDAVTAIYQDRTDDVLKSYQECCAALHEYQGDDRIQWRAVGLPQWSKLAQTNSTAMTLLLQHRAELQTRLNAEPNADDLLDAVEIDTRTANYTAAVETIERFEKCQPEILQDCWDEWGFYSFGEACVNGNRPDMIGKYLPDFAGEWNEMAPELSMRFNAKLIDAARRYAEYTKDNRTLKKIETFIQKNA